MLDIRFIRENPELVQQNAIHKGYNVSINDLLEVYQERKDLRQAIDKMRSDSKIHAAMFKDAGPTSEENVNKGIALRQEIAKKELELRPLDEKYDQLMAKVPNMAQEDVPIGGEDKSVEVKTWGEKNSGAVDHLDFAVARDWVDFERGAKVAGTKFYYLKGDLALLENAMTQYVLSILIKKNFIYLTVPHMVNSRTALGAGFSPRSELDSNEYFIEGEDLSLIGTAEAPLTGYHADEILAEAELPLLYAGYSPSYRKEAGTYGKHSRGLFRVHQFNKLEMYIYSLPEKSSEMHEMVLEVEEEIWQALGIPYHVINIASGDLGAPASKKYDLEYWSPVDQIYRELTSASNCTDFQARNLNIRVRRSNGDVEIVHTLNGTAVSLARSLVAVIEHYQNDNGTLRVPDVLRPYLEGRDTL